MYIFPDMQKYRNDKITEEKTFFTSIMIFSSSLYQVVIYHFLSIRNICGTKDDIKLFEIKGRTKR